MKLFRLRRSLPMQMALNFAVMILLTAAAVGLPAIWLLRDQLNRQAWALLDQGTDTSRALYEAGQGEVTGLAILTAQRPRLHDLVMVADPDPLREYMRVLQQGAGLDTLEICAPHGRRYAVVGRTIEGNVCDAPEEARLYVERSQTGIYAWLMAAHPLTGEAAGYGRVVVGVLLDDDYLAQIQRQTGVEQALLVERQVVAASQAGNREAWHEQAAQPSAPDEWAQQPVAINGRTYYAAITPWDDSGVATLAALDVTEIARSQRRLLLLMLAAILVVGGLGSAAGVLLAQRIARPLNDLASAAGALSWRDLDRPIAVESQIAEVSQVAQALDFARLELRGALADLRQERDWVNHLLDSIVEGTMTLDANGRITFFSQGAERVTGWPRHEAIGRTVDELFQMVDTSAPFSQFIPASGQKERLAVQMAAGQQATLAITGAQLAPPAARNAEVALVFRDVTEEEALHRLLGHFLANVAHEFRTPLSALAASIELLLAEAPDLSHEEFEELLGTLHLGILGLQTLVDNLLQSASIESGRFRISPRSTDLRQIIAEAAQTMMPLIQKHGQHLRLDLPADLPLLVVDGRRLTQVIVNLLSNAVKHGPDEAEILLAVTAGTNRVKIMVADEGPGVPPQHRGDLFHWFIRRQPDAARPPFGIGLGLAVVKAVVLAHQGRVGIEDRPGGGSIFWFDLPLSLGSRQ
ncbi:MAG: ATP-binding protein [Chloroflexota bacterium]